VSDWAHNCYEYVGFSELHRCTESRTWIL